jgi:hypothetical protein
MRKKHPYYDSDRKKRSEEFAMKAISICFVGMLIILIISSISKAIL